MGLSINEAEVVILSFLDTFESGDVKSIFLICDGSRFRLVELSKHVLTDPSKV